MNNTNPQTHDYMKKTSNILRNSLIVAYNTNYMKGGLYGFNKE
jgi:hypothetical protein